MRRRPKQARSRGLHRSAGPLLLGFLLTSCGTDAEAPPWLEFPWPEADRLFQQDPFWIGGDGAYSIDLGDDRVLWLFGDSWIDPRGTGRRRGARMVSNSLAIQHGYDPTQATVEFYWGAAEGDTPAAFFPDRDGLRFWPGHGTRLGNRLLLFLMPVTAVDTGLGFEVRSWDAVMIHNPDADPHAWDVEWLETPPAPRQIIVGSGAVLEEGDHVYAFGAQEPGGSHPIFLARWPLAAARQGDLAEPEWWGGDGWVSSPIGEGAAPVFDDGQTEFTVHRDPDSGVYRQVQTTGFGRAAVVQRTAPELTGPWSEPDTILVPAQNAFPNIMVYQGKAHPYLTGPDLVITYCTNSFEFSDHVAEPWIYFPRFARIDLGRSAARAGPPVGDP